MRILSLVMLAGALLVYSCKLDKPKSKPVAQCTCDTSAALLVINDSSFNRIGAYDTSSFTAQNFYELEPGINRQLWYRDIENTRATKFTTLWNAYYPANYYASQIDFLNQYCDRSDIELAFQFGPNHDLWAYHSFVVKKIACCYLVTRSYYRHARFNYKAYAFLNKQLADSLFAILDRTEKIPLDSLKSFGYSGFFADNRNRKEYYLDFERYFELRNNNDSTKMKSTGFEQLFNFVDKEIQWRITYGL